MLLKSNEYCLHDAILNNIILGKFGIELVFKNGIYSLSEKGKEDDLTSTCVIKIGIKNFHFEENWQHLQIFKYRKNKIREISIQELKELLISNAFTIDDSFWSDFSNGLIIEGNVNKFFIAFKVTEIDSIEYIFN